MRVPERLFGDFIHKEHISKKVYIYPDYRKLSQLENENTISLITSFDYWTKFCLMYWDCFRQWEVQMSFSEDEGHLVYLIGLRGMSPKKKKKRGCDDLLTMGMLLQAIILFPESYHYCIFFYHSWCARHNLVFCHLHNWPLRMYANSSASQIIIFSVLTRSFTAFICNHIYMSSYHIPMHVGPPLNRLPLPRISNSYSSDQRFTFIILSWQLRSLYVN